MLTEENSREVWRWAPVEDFLMDVRFGARMLRRNRGFTAVAVVTLALGIAVNTTIFSSVNGCILRRPRINVVVILTADPAKGGWGWDRQPVSAFDFAQPSQGAEKSSKQRACINQRRKFARVQSHSFVSQVTTRLRANSRRENRRIRQHHQYRQRGPKRRHQILQSGPPGGPPARRT